MATVDIELNNQPVWGLVDLTVEEDSTPLNAGDSSGAVGQVTAELDATDLVLHGRGKALAVKDSMLGVVDGTVRTVQTDGNGTATLTALTELASVTSERTAEPFSGTLDGLILYYLELGGVTANVTVDPTYAAIHVDAPAWIDDVWVQLKKLCTVYKFEITIVDGEILVRPARAVEAIERGEAGGGWDEGNAQLAQSVEVYYYESEYKVAEPFYPAGEWVEEAGGTTSNAWSSDVSIISVGYTEVVEIDVPINASLTSIQQPVCVSSVGKTVGGPSMYTIKGSHAGKEVMISPAQWNGNGGKVEVFLKEGEVDVVTIRVSAGNNSGWWAPYKLAMGSGDGEYSTLRIVGDGVFHSKHRLTVPTGLTAEQASEVVGTTVDNEFVNTLDQAYRAAAEVVPFYSGGVRSVSGDVDTLDIGGPQGYGNFAGSRIVRDGGVYRVRSVRVDLEGISYDAEADTLVSDFQEAWGDYTYAEFSALRGEQTFHEIGMTPLEGAE